MNNNEIAEMINSALEIGQAVTVNGRKVSGPAYYHSTGLLNIPVGYGRFSKTLQFMPNGFGSRPVVAITNGSDL